MKVELKVGKWGWRFVHVDGRAEPWAEIHWDSHGRRGRSYYWHDPVSRTRLMFQDGAGHMRSAEIRTNRYDDTVMGDPGPGRPTNERLLKVTEHLIRAGHILNPSVMREAMRKKEEARKRKAAQARERERKRFEKRAAGCLETIEATDGKLNHWQRRMIAIASIVEAMKWAQTR